MAIYLTELDPDTLWFPASESALSSPNGLLAFGGDLSTQRLRLAYQNGIFPWYGADEPILWWSPSPRATFDPKAFKPAKSVKKFQRKHQYSVTLNHATDSVIDYCASTRSKEQTWLNQEMRSAYKQLAAQGDCHSVEVWLDAQLIGGLYGVSIGQVFCGESMFSLATNASKIALWYFCAHFAHYGGQLIDCQVLNPHLASLGAVELNRQVFMQRLLSLKDKPVGAGCFTQQILPSPDKPIT